MRRVHRHVPVARQLRALHDQISSFAIGHWLFSLIDEFPFQSPEAPELSVSIPVGPGAAGYARLFGPGASDSYDDFVVTTQTG
jgi:hypothetical protein